MQKEKVEKNFYMGKKTAKWSLVILFALVIYTAPAVYMRKTEVFCLQMDQTDETDLPNFGFPSYSLIGSRGGVCLGNLKSTIRALSLKKIHLL